MENEPDVSAPVDYDEARPEVPDALSSPALEPERRIDANEREPDDRSGGEDGAATRAARDPGRRASDERPLALDCDRQPELARRRRPRRRHHDHGEQRHEAQSPAHLATGSSRSSHLAWPSAKSPAAR